MIITSTIGPRELLTRIWHIGNKLKGYTNKLVFSFVDVKAYRKVQNNLVKETIFFTKEDVENAEANYAQRIEIVQGLKKIREAWHEQGWDVEMATCAEDIDLESYGIEHNRCIDGELMKRILLMTKNWFTIFIHLNGLNVTCLGIFHLFPKREESKGYRTKENLRMHG